MSAAPPVFLDLRANGDAESHLFALSRRGVFFRRTGGQDGLLGSGTRTKRCLHDGDAFFFCVSFARWKVLVPLLDYGTDWAGLPNLRTKRLSLTGLTRAIQGASLPSLMRLVVTPA